MAVAVTILSPVTMITFTEASWHFLTASLTPSLKESLIPKTAKNTKLSWSINLLSLSTCSQLIYSFWLISLYAIYKLLNLSLLNSSIDCLICIDILSSKGFFSPVSGSI